MSTLTATPPRYSVVPCRVWELKPECAHLAVPSRVSIYGSLPSPRDAYQMVEKGFSIYDRKRNTYSNYFYGKAGIDSVEEGQAIIDKLTGNVTSTIINP